MSKSERVNYPGDEVVVTWEGDLCIHIGECGRAQGELFVGGRKPWCDPKLSSDDEVEEICERCPTGALSAEFADGSHVETPAAENTVQVAYNGPLFVRGDLAIDGAPEDVPGLNFRAALCRCGASKNKPFCDNSHESAGLSIVDGSTGQCHGGPGRAAARQGQRHTQDQQRSHRVAGRAGRPVPVWRFREQAVLRRQAQGHRL